MKIGLIGNMNNNNFALMRYFRDLGVDAHLLLYINDGQGTISHFKPEYDTWDIEKWAPYILQTNIPNAPVSALDFPLSWLVAGRAMFRTCLGLQEGWAQCVSRRQIRNAYTGFDRLVASGISPATLLRANLRLDIFYPYSTGVEFLETGEFVAQFSTGSKYFNLIRRKVAERQAKGVMSAFNSVNSEMAVTQDTFLSIGVTPRVLNTPSVYNRERLPDLAPTENLHRIAGLIRSTSFSIFHQSRLMWKNNGQFSDEDWRLESKNTQWLIHAFAQLVLARPELKPLLLIIEYGPDVGPTKQLAKELGIADCIEWLPKMGRRELLWVLSRVSVGCGEFYDVPKMIWGGTGWEALASGKPLLQGFNFELGEFEQIYGSPQPPMLPVRAQEDILVHLLEMADKPEKCEEIGQNAKIWFNRYNGIGLARKWLDILMAPRMDESAEKYDRQTKTTHTYPR